MKLTAPVPFKEALDFHEVKSLLPTTGKSVDLQKLDGPIKRRALWSATVQSVEILQLVKDATNAVLTGTSDEATQRLKIKQAHAAMGYAADPDKAGGLQDLASTPRVNLQIDTNVDIARGFAWDLQGQQADVIDEYPAQELIRDFAPKGKERDWEDRWKKAGGVLVDGRMIALKSDPIWSRLGDPDIFPDGLGNPFPPFAYSSGMGVRDIDRDEAEKLELIAPNQQVFPRGDLGLNDALEATPDVRDADLRAKLEATGLGKFNDAGVFSFIGGEA